MHGWGADRRSCQHSRLACYTRIRGLPLRGLSGPALARTGGQAWMIQSEASGRNLFLDDPVWGTAPPAACSAPDDPVRGVGSYFTR